MNLGRRLVTAFVASAALAAGCGADGTKGEPGAMGAKGDTGAMGAMGAPGAVGAKGDTGAMGAMGAMGALGAMGAMGAPGAQFNLEIVVPMTGEMEAPATIVTGNSGAASIAVDTQTGAITGSARVTFDATKVHVHGVAFAGDAAAVLFELEKDTSDGRLWRIPAKTVLAADKLAALQAGGLYLNAHSADHPNGEVRGQILPPDLQVFRATMDPTHEVPSPVAGTDNLDTAAGVGFVTLNVKTGVFHANVRTIAFVATKAHIHGAPDAITTPGIAGRTAAVFRELSLTTDSTPEDDFWTSPADAAALTGEQIDRLLAGEFYFNAHSASNATGLVRGQLHGASVTVLRVPLSGEQEVPKPTGTGGSSALGNLTIDLDSGRLRGDVVASGFAPTRGHVHTGKIGVAGPVTIEFKASTADANRFSAAEAGLNGSLNTFLDAGQLATLAGGGLYLNMHSAANPTGEVRGQIVPDGLRFVRVAMDSTHEIPAPTGAAGSSGLAQFVIDPLTGRTQGFGRVVGFAATAFHIHAGAEGATGPVVVEMTVSPTESDKFDLPDGVFLDLATLRASGFYVNAHSAANSTGEIRGQIKVP